MTATLSVVIPTIGRPTLKRALASCVGAYEVLVDENQDDDQGYAARERMIRKATGSHLCFLDDDDVFTGNALNLFSDAACEVPVIFKMRYWHGGELWRSESLTFGNVGTPMFVIPNVPEKLGRWEPEIGGSTGGDFVFLSGCVERMGPPKWRTEVVALIRPQ